MGCDRLTEEFGRFSRKDVRMDRYCLLSLLSLLSRSVGQSLISTWNVRHKR